MCEPVAQLENTDNVVDAFDPDNPDAPAKVKVEAIKFLPSGLKKTWLKHRTVTLTLARCTEQLPIVMGDLITKR